MGCRSDPGFAAKSSRVSRAKYNGYDVEHTSGDAQVTERFLQVAVDLHEHLKAPATFYVVGELAASYARWWRRLGEHPLFDVCQHPYSHRLVKPLCREHDHEVSVIAGASIEDGGEEIGRVSDAPEHVSGRRP